MRFPALSKVLRIFNSRKSRIADALTAVTVILVASLFILFLVQLHPKALHKNPLTTWRARNEDRTYYISGHDFMQKYTPDQAAGRFGYRIVHQTWKNLHVEDDQYDAFIAWEKVLDPASFLHVLWTDDDNMELLKTCYPEYLPRYNQLVLPVQKTDFIRVLYLHRYGGIYADLDVLPHMDVFVHLETHYSKIDNEGKKRLHDVLIVESPILLNEVMQNAFMVASVRNHDFFRSAADGINEIVTFINDSNMCKKWNGCQYVALFHNPILNRFVNMVMTLYVTGPSVLDKTFVRHVLGSSEDKWDVVKLPKEEYFLGSVVSHMQDNTWVNPAKALPELVNFLLAFILFVCGLVIVVWYQMRIIRSLRSQVNHYDRVGSKQ